MNWESTYCNAVSKMAEDSLHRKYHDTAYGFPIINDNELFGRLLLEINQAGLSWTTILNKEESFRIAYFQYDIKTVASLNDSQFEDLMNNSGIIRNRLKIQAAIYNANVILQLQKEEGSFLAWLHNHHPLKKEDWVKLFKKTFKFTGGEIVNEFLMSIGILPDAHHIDCPIYHKVIKHNPLWTKC